MTTRTTPPTNVAAPAPSDTIDAAKKSALVKTCTHATTVALEPVMAALARIEARLGELTLATAKKTTKSTSRGGNKDAAANPNHVPANVLLYFKKRFTEEPDFRNQVDPNKADPNVYKPGTTPDTLQVAVAGNVGSKVEGSDEYFKAMAKALYDNINDDFKDTLRKERTALVTLHSAQGITTQLNSSTTAPPTPAPTLQVGDILDTDF